jgi:hypothetical protein
MTHLSEPACHALLLLFQSHPQRSRILPTAFLLQRARGVLRSCQTLYFLQKTVVLSVNFLPHFSSIDLVDACSFGKFDALVIPGGAKGAETMSQSVAVQNLVQDYIKQDKIVAMICAGKVIFCTHPLSDRHLLQELSLHSLRNLADSL